MKRFFLSIACIVLSFAYTVTINADELIAPYFEADGIRHEFDDEIIYANNIEFYNNFTTNDGAEYHYLWGYRYDIRSFDGYSESHEGDTFYGDCDNISAKINPQHYHLNAAIKHSEDSQEEYFDFTIILKILNNNKAIVYHDEKTVRLGFPRGIPGDISIINPHFITQCYNWEYDIMVNESVFAFDLESENAERFEMKIPIGNFHSIENWEHFLCRDDSSPHFWYILEPSDPDNPNHFEINADWGEIYFVLAYNKNGVSRYSGPIFTTDYITDPDILARIKEINDIETGIVDLNPDMQSGEYPVFKHDRIYCPENIRELSIYNSTGETVLSSTNPFPSISIENLDRGIYFVVYKDLYLNHGTLKICK